MFQWNYVCTLYDSGKVTVFCNGQDFSYAVEDKSLTENLTPESIKNMRLASSAKEKQHLSGKISGFQIWDFPLDNATIRKFENCSQNLNGRVSQ